MEHTCFNCGTSLQLNPEVGTFQCPNPACEVSGRPLQPCEICGRYAVTGQPAMCLNPDCASHGLEREVCATCNRSTEVYISRLSLCLNPDCRRNIDLPDCWFCGWNSLSRADYRSLLVSCRNKNCEGVLKLIRQCPVCNENAFDLHQGRCLNPSCPTMGRRVSECPTCGRKRYFGDPELAEPLCANPECELWIGQADQRVSPTAGVGQESAEPPPMDGENFESMNVDATIPLPVPTPAELDQFTPASQEGEPEGGVTLAMPLDEIKGLLEEAGEPRPTVPDGATEGVPFPDIQERLDSAEAAPADAPTGMVPATDDGGAWEGDGWQESRGDVDDDDAAGMSDPLDSDPPASDVFDAMATVPPAAPPTSPGDSSSSNDRIDAKAFNPATAPSSESLLDRIDSTVLGDTAPASASEFFASVAPPDGAETNDPPVSAPDAGLFETPANPGFAPEPGLHASFAPASPPVPLPSASMDDFEFGGNGDAEQVDFNAAYRYLQESILNPPGKPRAPLYLVLGLAGVGKTCFLTMLGQVLQGRQFYTPKPAIRPQMVQIAHRFQRYIKDLVFTYSIKKYDNFLSQGVWPPPDIPDQTKEFLTTELLAPDGSQARLATLEISGEVYQKFIPEVSQIYTDPTRIDALPDDLRIIWNMMQQAEGIVILLEGTDISARSHVYGSFFQALAQWKEQQIRSYLNEQYERFLTREEDKDPLIMRIIRGVHSNERGPVTFEDFASDLRRRAQLCLQALQDGGITRLLGERFRDFEGFRMYYLKVNPNDQAMRKFEQMLESDPNLRDGSNQQAAFEQFVEGLLQKFFSDTRFLEQVYQLSHAQTEQLEDNWKIFMRYVSWRYKLDEQELQILDSNTVPERRRDTTHPFDKLKYLSIAFTKTDKDFAIYPASNFPRVVKVNWADPLPRLSNYLTLCGGYLRYYNSSVTGYSVRQDGSFTIGRRGTLTPINVAEPILDMLTHTGIPPLDEFLSDET